MRYYLGVDWADQTHAVWVMDEDATKIAAHPVPHSVDSVHRSPAFFPSPESRIPSPAYCRAVSSARFDGAL